MGVIQVDPREVPILGTRNPAGDTDDGGVLGYLADHHRDGANHGVIANRNVPEHLGAGADDHIVPDGRMALAPLLPGAALVDPLKERDIVADHGGLPDDDPRAMVDEEPPANRR